MHSVGPIDQSTTVFFPDIVDARRREKEKESEWARARDSAGVCERRVSAALAVRIDLASQMASREFWRVAEWVDEVEARRTAKAMGMQCRGDLIAVRFEVCNDHHISSVRNRVPFSKFNEMRSDSRSDCCNRVHSSSEERLKVAATVHSRALRH